MVSVDFGTLSPQLLELFVDLKFKGIILVLHENFFSSPFLKGM